MRSGLSRSGSLLGFLGALALGACADEVGSGGGNWPREEGGAGGATGGAGGLAGTGGTSSRSCQTSLDCNGEGVCGPEKVCVDCAGAEDCPDDHSCVDHRCRPRCDSDRDCVSAGLLCDKASGYCVECLGHGECQAAQHCASGSCRADVCVGGSRACREGAVVECSEAGDGYGAPSACGSRQSCVESGGVASCADWRCTAGTVECADNKVVTCSADGLVVDSVVSCGAEQICQRGACRDRASPGECFDAATQVYLVDSDYTFLKFEPQTMAFTRLGALKCPAGKATPNSMAVDRSGTAWVNYSDGSIFHVDIETLVCKATAYVPNQQGFGTLGIGFVSDAPGSSAESLFVTDGGRLGKIDTKTLVLEQIGTVQDEPEFAGNGLGELWGFSPPDQQASQPGGLVQKLDKTSGKALKKYNLTLEPPPPPPPFGNGTGVAWAFAFWGGSYYLFYQGPRAETDVYQFNPTNGTTQMLSQRPGGRIVGASASTCAPVVPPI